MPFPYTKYQYNTSNFFNNFPLYEQSSKGTKTEEKKKLVVIYILGHLCIVLCVFISHHSTAIFRPKAKLISLAIFCASFEIPSKPCCPNPAQYNPFSPFQ